MDGDRLPDSGSANGLELTRRALLVGIAGAVVSETAVAKKRRRKAERRRTAKHRLTTKRRRKRGKKRHRGSRPAPVDPPAPPADSGVAQLTWFLQRLNGAPVTEDDIQERFVPDYFLSLSGAVLPPTEVIRRLRLLGEALAPVSVQSYWTPPSGENPFVLYPIIESRGDTYQMFFNHEASDLYRFYGSAVDGFVPGFREDWPTSPVLWEDWAEFDRHSGDFAPLAGVLAQEIDDGPPRTIHSHQSDVELEIGSVFKLYVLGALATAIEAGEADWEEVLPVREDWRSFDTGYLDTMPSPRLIDHAVLMWSASDNTATDHLLFRLGRERVEAMLEPMGHQQPQRNRPFLATREYFALNMAVPPKRATAYAEADEATRRQLLEEEILGTDMAYMQALDWVHPRNHWTIGWFATLSDMTRAMLALDEMSRRPGLELLRAIMGQSGSFDGSMADLSVWPTIFGKYGITKGAQCYVCLLERDDGKRFTLAIGHNDPRKPLDHYPLPIPYAGAAGLLAREDTAPRAVREAKRARRRGDPGDSLRGIVSDGVLEAIRNPDPRRPQMP